MRAEVLLHPVVWHGLGYGVPGERDRGLRGKRSKPVSASDWRPVIQQIMAFMGLDSHHESQDICHGSTKHKRLINSLDFVWSA